MLRNRYFLYILRCRDGKLYTGITTDLARRLKEHASPKHGAKFTRGRDPFRVLYTRAFASRSLASKEEYRIKTLSLSKKKALITESSKT